MGGMDLRTHIGRPLDFRNRWNQAIVLLTGVAAAVGLAGNGDVWLPVRAAATTFLAWALCRELDPDHQVSALLAAVAGGAWVLFGQPTGLLALLALMTAARVVTETTGRRPLPTDLAGLAVLATAVSFTRLGWVMGFGLAVAIYLDQRLSKEAGRAGLYASIGAAAGSSLLATLTDAFPRDLPTVRPLLATALGVIALAAILREPSPPVSFVDSRDRRFLRRDRLHVSRILAGILVFFASLLAGDEGLAVAPMALTLAIALASAEMDRIVRADRPA